MNLKKQLGSPPQSSILGPTLFILYTSDLDQYLTHGTNLGTFADDTTLYSLVQSTTEMDRSTKSLQEVLGNLARWSTKMEDEA